MPKIKICCNNHATHQSTKWDVIDTEVLEIPEGETWEELSEEKRSDLVLTYILDSGWVETWYEEVD